MHVQCKLEISGCLYTGVDWYPFRLSTFSQSAYNDRQIVVDIRSIYSIQTDAVLENTCDVKSQASAVLNIVHLRSINV